MRPRGIAWVVSLPFWVGVLVFVVMFPFHPTVDLELVNYLPMILPLGAILAATSYGAWRLAGGTTDSATDGAGLAQPRLAAAAMTFWGLALAACVWALVLDLDSPYRVWDWLFSAPAIGAILGAIALAVVPWLPAQRAKAA